MFCGRVTFPGEASSAESGFYAIGGEGEFAKAPTSGVEDGIAEGGGDQGDCGFSGAGRWFRWAIDENDIDGGQLDSEREGVVGLPIDRSHLAIVLGNFLAEGAAHALQ
jgi:hypothetical protein